MKTLKSLTVLSILSIILFSCGMPMGNRVDKGNLKVYYLEGVKKQEAIDFANFWVDEGYVGEEEQTIQLEVSDEIILVKIIESVHYQNEPLSINEQAMLQDIERKLNKDVFSRTADLQITDNTFRPIDRSAN